MADIEVIKVIVDIAGMYYGRSVTVKNGSTVREALIAARVADKADRNNGKNVPQLNFAEDDRSPEFLRSITVDHAIPVESRQTQNLPVAQKRFYPAGEYTFRSDGVIIGERIDGTDGFIAVDQSGKETGKGFIQTWQYYVYDANGVDTSRQAASALTRKVVPFSILDNSNILVDGGQIVFRLVTIFLGPTRSPGIKTADKKQLIDKIGTPDVAAK
jgi:hypothetical protein